jgi:hypothetical protein
LLRGSVNLYIGFDTRLECCTALHPPAQAPAQASIRTPRL